MKHKMHMQPPPPQQKIPLIPVQQPRNPPFIQSPAIAPFNMTTAPQPPPPYIQTWNFKVGDRCLAKYWEDEKYYNAEIQAVTDKTCVVHFMEYGNFEEVLHTDCLPLTDNNHQPINQLTNFPPAGQMHAMPAAYAPMPPQNKPPHFHQNNYPPHHARE